VITNNKAADTPKTFPPDDEEKVFEGDDSTGFFGMKDVWNRGSTIK
jgi:hypothetical protein